MKKVLVTGATGFIGRQVLKVLAKHPVQIIGTARGMVAPMAHILWKPFDLHHPDQPGNLMEYFHHPDIIFHLAWEGLPHYTQDFHLKNNLPAHINFLTRMVEEGAQDILVSGTCFEYGLQEGCLREDLATQPTNAYAQAKDRLRQALERLQQEHPFFLKWARLFYMYGSGQHPHSLLAQLETALEKGDKSFNMSGGEQTRDFLPVEQVAEALVNIGLQQRVLGIINVCSNRPITVKQLVLDYIHAKNKEIHLNLGFYPYNPIEPMHFWGDDQKLKSIK